MIMKLPKGILDRAWPSYWQTMSLRLVKTGWPLAGAHNVSRPDIKAVENFYIEKGIEPLVRSLNVTLTQQLLLARDITN